MTQLKVKTKTGKIIELTHRESEILTYISVGKRTKWIATTLGLSPRTVDNYIYRMKEKTSSYSREELCDIIQNKEVSKSETNLNSVDNKDTFKDTKKRMISGLFLLILLLVTSFFYFQREKIKDFDVFEWNIPFYSQIYISRNKLFNDVSKKFQNNSKENIVTVFGLGGVGKTTFAAHYLFKTKKKYKKKIWIDAEKKFLLKQQFLQLGEYKALYNKSDNIDIKILKVIKWLEKTSNSLIVFDNVENYSDLKGFIPRYNDILITSQNHQMPSSVHLDVMFKEEAKDLFVRTLHKELEDSNIDIIKLEKLFFKLGYLPMAIVQAGSYIRESNISIEAFNKLYDNHLNFLFKSSNSLILINHPSIFVTWDLNLKKIKEDIAGEDTLKVLRFMSLCHPGKIHKDLLSFYLYGKKSFETDLKINEIIALLKTFSLVNSEQDYLSLHRLVHTWLYYNLDSDTRALLHFMLV